MKKKHNGFTIIELICVLAIISIAAAAAVPNITGYVERSQKKNCDAVMQGIVDDIRYKCLSKRFESEDTLNEEIENIISSSSENKIIYSESKTEEGHLINSCAANAICPNDGVYRFKWKTTDGISPENLILTITYCCDRDRNKGSDNEKTMSLNIVLKQPHTMEYYNYLKSIATIVCEQAQREVTSQMSIGRTPSEAAADCCGRLQADKCAYIYRSGDSTDGINIESLSSVADIAETDDLFEGTEDNMIWGITIDVNGLIEWMCYHCRYKDINGELYEHYIVIANGEIITSKEDYFNLIKKSDKGSTPPVQGTLGSTAYKAEWKDEEPVIIGQQTERDCCPIQWYESDNDWYVQK